MTSPFFILTAFASRRATSNMPPSLLGDQRATVTHARSARGVSRRPQKHTRYPSGMGFPGRASLRMSSLNHGNADTQKQRSNRYRSKDGPPRTRSQKSRKRKQSPPKRHLTKIVWMSRPRPDSCFEHASRRWITLAKTQKLIVRDPFASDTEECDGRSDHVFPPKRFRRLHRRPHGEASTKHEKGWKHVDA